jgi:glycosyltransferase involved in cell wall biosynthesis
MSTAYPEVSIIIPTRNRLQQIESCVQSLTQLDYPPDCFEVIVVDDGSTRSPASVVENFRKKIDVKLLTQVHSGPSAARNTGARKAGGQLLAFTDDDCMPRSDWLQRIAARFAETPDHLIGGRTLNALNRNAYSTTSQLIVDVVYAYYNTNGLKPTFFASNNLALPARLFHEIGGFDTNFRAAEDRELCDRWRHHRFQMTYAPEAVVYHAHPLKARSFLAQHFGYGRGAFRFHKIRTRRGSGRFSQELKFYRRLPFLMAQSLSRVSMRQAILTVPLLLGWQAANAAGFFWEMSQDN